MALNPVVYLPVKVLVLYILGGDLELHALVTHLTCIAIG